MEIETKCYHCEYKWKTKSKLNWITCPSCRKNIEKADINKKVSTIKKYIRKIKCHKCDHEWNSTSVLKYVTCPSCRNKINTGDFSIIYDD